MAYKHHDEGEEYKVVSYVDVNDLLTFAKKEYKSLEDQIKEEKRIEEELKKFIKNVQNHSNYKIHFIGHEKRYGNHLARFLFKDSGFLEIMLEKPLAINAHFVNEDAAKKFASGLRKALDAELSDSPVKKMIIDSIKVENGFEAHPLTLSEWSKMHRIAIHRTVVVTIIALQIVLIMELTKYVFHTVAAEFFHLQTYVVALLTALAVAFLFEPVKNKVEHYIEKIFGT
jgi:hypothetical protein